MRKILFLHYFPLFFFFSALLTGCAMGFKYDTRLCSEEQIENYLLKARKMQDSNPEAADSLYQRACECQGRKDCSKANK